ncbi:MAG: peptide deformylase [Candidatus Moraniibacteriota bacterium]|nr:MAG: peptide deformylase [Candidatus Moranbacteria bacterium]
MPAHPDIVTGATNTLLHTKTTAVKNPLDPAIQALLPNMVRIMREANGIGLAAPQIGLSLRLCVIEIDGVVRNLINPKITSTSRETVLFEEGCLSLPEEYFSIERFAKVTVRYQNEKGEEVKLRAHGLLAVCIQHELDHLDGTLIIDRYRKQRSHS